MSTEPNTCDRIFAELEVQRIHTVAKLSEWSTDRVRYRPTPGAWSAIEVLDHIVRAETETLGMVRIGVRNPHVLGPEDRPGIAALDRALRSEESFQVPPGAKAIYPDAQSTLPQIAKRWEQTRVEIERLFEVAPENAHCGVFCHPFAGWMTFAEVLDHFSAHLYHHGFQLERLRVSSAHLSPAS